MQDRALPFTHDIVLVGGGHTHALVLRKWGMNPMAGVRLTLINPGPTAPYSGMLPGHVAGHYTREALDIDLVRLARFAGARLVIGAAQHIDVQARLIDVPGRPPIAYDLCSVDIGITSEMPGLPGFADHAVPAKPLGAFADAWAQFVEAKGAAHVAVIGAGVAGAELALAMAHQLRARGRSGQVTLIDRSAALSALGEKAAHALRATLAALGIALIENTEVSVIEAGSLTLGDGRELPADFITGAAGAQAHPWLAGCGLELEQGYIAVNDHLQSSAPDLFAVGDCAHLSFDPRPKAGVYAVRQAPVLFDNLRAQVSGRPMQRYRAQKDYLKLVSLGAKSALGERFGMTFKGSWVWRLKDRIDQDFMNRFRDLPLMPQPELPFERTLTLEDALGPKPLCGGCGAKIGRIALRGGLGPEANDLRDDAALLRTGGVDQVFSTDHLRGFTLDAVTMSRIALHHAMGDIWAMGAMPQAVTATLILPRQSELLAARQVAEISQALRVDLAEAGAVLVGGHTTLGAEMTIGFALTGLCERAPITLAGARSGDRLILTKPLGSGVLMAAEMQMQAKGAWIAGALAAMVQSQKSAANTLRGAHAMTDVTGFGLIGHLLNICEASGLGAQLDANSVPVMPGARELARAGVRSSLYPANRALAPDLPETPEVDLLFDPQTSGGLLAALAPTDAERALGELRDAGYDAAEIGYLVAGAVGIALSDAPPTMSAS